MTEKTTNIKCSDIPHHLETKNSMALQTENVHTEIIMQLQILRSVRT
jgi:hypothetical protein